MPDFDALAAMVDRAAFTIEDDALDTIARWLVPMERRLIDETRAIGRITTDSTAGEAIRKARAQVLLADVRAVLDGMTIGPDSDVHAAFVEMHRRAYEEGIRTADDTLRAYSTDLPAEMRMETFRPRVDLDRLASLATESTERLSRYAPETVARITETLSDGISRGHGIGRMTRDVREVTDLVRYRAERIVRTEVMSSVDDARRTTFSRSGVDHVQRIATNDEKVCPYCAARDGNVYRLADRPTAILHPNDRCVLVPWSERWPAAVRGDAEHAARKREAIRRAREEDPDFTPDDGPTYWERERGEPPPEPVWTPPGSFA